eukprot:COSAG06_NODE_60232_length_271_cov_1.186047_1_plen_90_part_11
MLNAIFGQSCIIFFLNHTLDGDMRFKYLEGVEPSMLKGADTGRMIKSIVGAVFKLERTHQQNLLQQWYDKGVLSNDVFRELVKVAFDRTA